MNYDIINQKLELIYNIIGIEDNNSRSKLLEGASDLELFNIIKQILMQPNINSTALKILWMLVYKYNSNEQKTQLFLSIIEHPITDLLLLNGILHKIDTFKGTEIPKLLLAIVKHTSFDEKILNLILKCEQVTPEVLLEIVNSRIVRFYFFNMWQVFLEFLLNDPRKKSLYQLTHEDCVDMQSTMPSSLISIFRSTSMNITVLKSIVNNIMMDTYKYSNRRHIAFKIKVENFLDFLNAITNRDFDNKAYRKLTDNDEICDQIRLWSHKTLPEEIKDNILQFLFGSAKDNDFYLLSKKLSEKKYYIEKKGFSHSKTVCIKFLDYKKNVINSIKKIYKERSLPQIPQGLNLVPAPRDGHCLYHAVALYLQKNIAELRNIVASHLEQNIAHYQEFIALPQGKTIESYIENIRSTNEWGGDLEITILSRLLNSPIIAIGPEGTIINRQILDMELNGEPIFVYYNNIAHYDGVVLQDGYTTREILANLLQNASTKAINF